MCVPGLCVDGELRTGLWNQTAKFPIPTLSFTGCMMEAGYYSAVRPLLIFPLYNEDRSLIDF